MLAALNSAGLFDRLREWGIEYLYYHQVDNPAARICDPAFLGWHALREAQVSTKVVRKRNAEEKMGVAVDLEGRTQIIEYSDLSPELTGQNNAQGELLFWAGSTAMHVFSTQYLARLVEDEVELPWHVARKIVSHVDRDGKAITPVEPNACKFERFIFDILPLADRALLVEADRQREFHPVKNASGSDSADSVRAALSKLHRRWLEESGALVEEGANVELSARLVLDLDSGF
jgi:UDP-N-acetylglucosamine/UDP-N-acetylgalactosamine diphosphorylase